MKYTRELFIEKANQVHNNKYNYDKVEYINSTKHVIITCSEHGDFILTPKNHLKNRGCPVCGSITRGLKLRSNKELFIEKSNKIHHNKYNYDKFIYVKNNIKGIITCPIHGDFLLFPMSHLNGCGCELCSRTSTKEKLSWDRDKFISEAMKIHGDKYNYDEVNYVNMNTEVAVRCNICNLIFNIKPKHFIYLEEKCPYCYSHISKGELYVKELLDKQDIKYILLYFIKSDDDKYMNFKCRVDFYIPDYNMVIEYNGLLHYLVVEIFGGEERFLKLVKRDNLLREYCKDNGIKLVEIKYDMLKSDIEKILEENNGMKFDCIVSNAPYDNGLHEKFEAKYFDLCLGEIVWVSPLSFLLGKKLNKNITLLLDKYNTVIEQINGNEYFDAAIGGTMGIVYSNIKEGYIKHNTCYILFDGKKYNKCEEITLISNDELLVEFKKIIEPLYLNNSLLQYIKYVPGIKSHAYGLDTYTEHNPDYNWWCVKVSAIRGHVNSDGTKKTDYYTFITNDDSKIILNLYKIL